jgi:hypothetical protein
VDNEQYKEVTYIYDLRLCEPALLCGFFELDGDLDQCPEWRRRLQFQTAEISELPQPQLVEEFLAKWKKMKVKREQVTSTTYARAP